MKSTQNGHLKVRERERFWRCPNPHRNTERDQSAKDVRLQDCVFFFFISEILADGLVALYSFTSPSGAASVRLDAPCSQPVAQSRPTSTTLAVEARRPLSHGSSQGHDSPRSNPLIPNPIHHLTTTRSEFAQTPDTQGFLCFRHCTARKHRCKFAQCLNDTSECRTTEASASGQPTSTSLTPASPNS